MKRTRKALLIGTLSLVLAAGMIGCQKAEPPKTEKTKTSQTETNKTAKKEKKAAVKKESKNTAKNTPAKKPATGKTTPAQKTPAKKTPAGEQKKTDANTLRFPAFTGKGLNGKDISDKSFKEADLTVLTLWDSQCKDCAKNLRSLNEKSGEWNKKIVQLIGLHVDAGENKDKEETAKKLLQDGKIEFPNIAVAKNQPLGDLLKNIKTYPTILLVNAKGEVIGEPFSGEVAKDMKTFEARIDKALQTRTN